jgi:Concanavalin A-like lectin/glucanases superfamily
VDSRPLSYRRGVKRALFAAFLLCTLVAAASAAAALPNRPLVTSVDADLQAFNGPQRPLAYQMVRAAGANVVRINVIWRQVLKSPSRKPSPFNPENPADPQYDWTEPDTDVRLAVASGLQPMLTLVAAPRWAEGVPRPQRVAGWKIGSWRPDPSAAAAFAKAVAIRYGGSFQGLPRVRYFEIWNEPNLVGFLAPQAENGKLVGPTLYRNLLNAMANAIHGVHSDNVVSAGSTAPFTLVTQGQQIATSPMVFMRDFLCMSADPHPRPTCSAKAAFDAWSHHPFTPGGPTRHAVNRDDVGLGDLPAMKNLLDVAYKAGHIHSAKPPEFWVTEFAWDTLPPDPLAVPIDLQSRWISEALYRSWKAGVSLFTWFQLWDEPGYSRYQDGLFFRNGEDLRYAQPKPSFTSFRFPFVAYQQRKKVFVWGRTPYGVRGRVLIQRMTKSGWRKAGAFTANRYGIFSGKVKYVRTAPAKPAAPQTNAPSYHDLVVSASPMSYWPLDERGGSVASDVSKANSGVYEGGVQLGVPGPIPGTTAAAFDGETGRVRLGRVGGLHSVEFWLKTKTDREAAAFSNRDTNHQFTTFGVLGTMAHSHDTDSIAAAQVADGEWHHLVYTYDSPSSTGKIYVDGKLSQFSVWKRVEGGGAGNIAYDASLRSYLNGDVAQVAVYPYVLSAAQIKSHFEASGRSLAPDVPRGMWRAYRPSQKSGSLPFSLVRPPDRTVAPFGGGGG